MENKPFFSVLPGGLAQVHHNKKFMLKADPGYEHYVLFQFVQCDVVQHPDFLWWKYFTNNTIL